MQTVPRPAGATCTDREPRLERIVEQALARLRLSEQSPGRIIDLGCGTGEILRRACRSLPRLHGLGIGVSAEQVDRARRLTRAARLNDRLTFLTDELCRTAFPACRFDGALAVDSARHAAADAGVGLLREARRLLRPRRYLAVADLFRRDDRPLPPWLATTWRRYCDVARAGGGLPCLDAFCASAADLGYGHIEVADLGDGGVEAADLDWRAEAGATGPAAVSGEGAGNGRSVEEPDEGAAQLIAVLLGAAPDYFGYYLVSARKGG